MGRMYQPDGTIKRRDDGKILKNKEYPKVDLADLVESPVVAAAKQAEKRLKGTMERLANR